MERLPITVEPALSVGEKMRITFDLAEAGVEVMRAKLGREHPGADDAEIARLLAEWMGSSPAVGPGDPIQRPGRGRFGEA